MLQKFLAFDLGAESGRGVVGEFDGEKITLSEADRFPTTSDSKTPGSDGIWRWNHKRIVDEILSIIVKTERNAKLSGIAVDTWGVDYGLLDKFGSLIEEPVVYRDASHETAMAKLLSKFPLEELWMETGIQVLPFNTLFQLHALQDRNPTVLDRAETLLFMPDLLASAIVGRSVGRSELTIASTSQMLHPTTHTWNMAFLERLGIPTHFLKPVVEPAFKYGTTPGGSPVWAAAGHDTASAVAAAPVSSVEKWAYLSSGTWSLLGLELQAPELRHEALHSGLSNEIGAGRATTLLKNIMGLWLVQETRRSLARDGQAYSYAELTALAAQAPANGALVDASDSRFLAPLDMPSEIRAAALESGQKPPESVGELVRCCLDSLALAYRRTLSSLESLSGSRYEALHILGGGTQNRLLNQLAADAVGIPVVAGPVEATAIGNILAQLIGSGAVHGWDEARQVVRNSFVPETFLPNPSTAAQWNERDSQFNIKISTV